MRLGAIAVLGVLFAANLAGAQDLVIVEIMYNSQESGGEDVEYVEILNAGEDPFDLAGYYLVDDNDTHGVVMLSGTLESCGLLLVANNNDAFVAKYGAGFPLNPDDMDSGPWGLGNGGDDVRLFHQDGVAPDPATDTLVDVVQYDDESPWPTEPDGDGPALELIDPALENNDPPSWAITVVDGTPGFYYNCSPVSVEGTTWGRLKAIYR